MKILKLGEALRAHGVRGGILFRLFSGPKTILQKGMTVTLLPRDKTSLLPEKGKVFFLSRLSFYPRIIVYLEGVTTRNEVESLLPFDLFLPRKDFPLPHKDELYLTDLMGLSVLDHQTKEEIGSVRGFFDNKAQLILEIRGKINRDIPFLDFFFPVIDLQSEFLEVRIPKMME